MGSITGSCLWDKSKLPYPGLNTHSSFGELSAPYTPDCLHLPEATAGEAREAQREYYREYSKTGKYTRQAGEHGLSLRRESRLSSPRLTRK
jgi:hypothetical protein